MRVFLASDHAGFGLKEKIRVFLSTSGHEVTDLGPADDQRSNYAEYGARAAAAVAADPGHARAVLVCGSGIGMSIVANKFRGVRAALCHSPYTAEMSRAHNDANVLALGARVLDEAAARQIVTVFLATAFSGGRHAERLRTIDAIEEDQCRTRP